MRMISPPLRRFVAPACVLTATLACSSSSSPGTMSPSPADAASGVTADGPSAPTPIDAPAAAACAGGAAVPGATLPAGMCLQKYADVGEARALVFAPNGDLFVAAPSKGAPGGAEGGPGAIMVLSDDNHDG